MNWDQLLSALEPWGFVPSGVPFGLWRNEPYSVIYWQTGGRCTVSRWIPPERREPIKSWWQYMEGTPEEVVEFFIQQEGDKRRAA